jgi:hypothetical protein
MPPKKLCVNCLRDPIHNLNVFQKMLKHYGLTKKDVEHVPKYSRMKSYSQPQLTWLAALKIHPFRFGSTLAQQSVMEDIARAKGKEIVESCPIPGGAGIINTSYVCAFLVGYCNISCIC